MKDLGTVALDEKNIVDAGRAYQKPVLKTYGPVKSLTQGNGSLLTDGGGTKAGTTPLPL